MKQTILGRKLGMTQVFDHQGNAIPVTIIQAGPCHVLQVKTQETDGYNAVQLGFMDKKEKRTTKPLKGHFEKAGTKPLRYAREARVDDPSQFTIGQVITSGRFIKGDLVDITGISKGKGFAGVMKRHGFGGFAATHGTHESKRGPGSIGQSADPAKTFKAMKMPGRMGGENVTVQNLVIVDTREDQNLLLVKGPVPGGKNGLLIIRHAVKKAAPPPRETEPPIEESAEPEQEVPEKPIEVTEPAVDEIPDAGAEPEDTETDTQELPAEEPETETTEDPGEADEDKSQ
jgi:large subunit ribosomal protein L3